MIRGVICDLDGFLVETWKTTPLPGVVETLAALKQRGIRLAVASNQAGPLWRMATEQEQYPGVEEVGARLFACAKALSLQDARWYVACFDARALAMMQWEAPGEPGDELWEVWNELNHQMLLDGLGGEVSSKPEWRKPEPGMLLAACEEWGITPAEAVYGGDLDSDREAAQAAGMRYVEKLSDVLVLLESEG